MDFEGGDDSPGVGICAMNLCFYTVGCVWNPFGVLDPMKESWKRDVDEREAKKNLDGRVFYAKNNLIAFGW